MVQGWECTKFHGQGAQEVVRRHGRNSKVSNFQRRASVLSAAEASRGLAVCVYSPVAIITVD